MIFNDDFKDPLEFARLIQTVPELKELIKSLAGFRKYLAIHNALDGFKAKILGFDISTYE